MHPSRFAIFLAAWMPVSAACAALPVSFLDQWEEEEQWMQSERASWQKLMEAEASPELLPEPLVQEDESGVIGNRREERTSEYLEIRLGGGTLLLSDVPKAQWFAPYVREIAERGIVSGYRDAQGNLTGLYGPADAVTVGQLAKIAVESSASGSLLCTQPPLNATASGGWMAPFVGCAEVRGWSLFADGSVDVQRPADRSEVIITMLQALQRSPEERTGNEFSDVTFSTPFGAYIEQAKRDGIVSGYTDAFGTPTGVFGPTDLVTRAEIAKIITLALQIYSE